MQSEQGGSPRGGRPHPSRLTGRKLIKKKFQIKFSLIILSFMALAALVIWMSGHFSVSYIIKNGLVSDPEAIFQLRRVNAVVGQTSVLALAVMFFICVFFSNYIAGPIYRLEKSMEEIGRGNLNITVRLRKSDELQDTADVFNRAIGNLRQRILRERESYSALQKAAEDAGEFLLAQGFEDQQQAILERLRRAKNSLSEIRI